MSTGIQMPFDSCSKFSKIMQKAIDTNLNILDKLGQFVTDFFYGAYSFNLVTTSHKDK